ncbi:MAG: transposase family protein [Gammaproteobacteria bacterium]|nr:transposase family protein [Gammaproteobacteria bacterium]
MHTADLGINDYFQQLAQRLNAVGHGQRGDLVDKAAGFLGMSTQQIYRHLKNAGWRSGKKIRADKGDSRLSEDEARLISNMMMESSRANGKRLLSTVDAMEILEANDKLTTVVSPATALRVMRLRGLHPDQLSRPTPHVTMRSLHPNHTWQFDVSLCVLYYLKDGNLSVMDADKFYKNKPDNFLKVANERVQRYLITDHYTGALYVQYYLTPGENVETLFNFFMAAIAKKSHSQDPLHGVPFQMIWDLGAANQSFMIKNLWDRLGIKHWAHKRGNSRAKGQVECSHNIVERKFEGRLFLLEITNLDQLNDYAHKWMRHLNGTAIHSRHGYTRYALWQTIRREQLRVAPARDLCEQLLSTKPEQRQVKGNLIISYKIKGFDSHSYSVSHVPGIRVGEYVDVCVNPYRAPNVDVIVEGIKGEKNVYECEPLEKDNAGFFVSSPVVGETFKSLPDTDVDRNRKRMAKEAYGADTEEEVEKARKKHQPAFGGDIDPMGYLEGATPAHYMPRPGTEMDMPSRADKALPLMTTTAACKRLLPLFDGALPDGAYANINTWYPNGVPEEAFDELVERLRIENPRPKMALVK